MDKSDSYRKYPILSMNAVNSMFLFSLILRAISIPKKGSFIVHVTKLILER